MKLRLSQKALAAFAVFLASAGNASAISVLGNLRAGFYTRTVEFEEPINGDTTNDEQTISAQLKMDVTDFDSHKDAFVIDVRDKIDSYGKLNTTNLSLETYNRLQVREVAFKRPWEYNKFYFTLGRFSLTEANIIGNDGGEFGYRFSKTTRFGLFGGMAPKDIVTPYYIRPDTESVDNAQGGLYLSYEKKTGVTQSIYTNNAVAMSPTYNITDKKSHTYFYHMAIWNLSQQNRISSYIRQDFVPTSSLRRASLAHSYYGQKVQTNLSFSQTNTEDYLIRKDILDPLPPSGEQLIRFELRHRMLSFMSVDYSAGYGKRAEGGESQSEYALGLIFPRLFTNSGSLRTQYGMRNNYFSKDTYIRGGYDYWNQYFSASIIHTMTNQEYESTIPEVEEGFKNTRQVTTLDAGFFVNQSIRGSFAYQMEKDDKLSANALFLMIGYRFGTSPAVPIRTRPALFEEI